MLVYVSTFWVPKRDCAPQEYEDASWVSPDGVGTGEMTLRSLRVAAADGASESLLAGRWARRLVTTFGTAKEAIRTKTGFVAAYREAAGGWDEEFAQYLAEREERDVPIQWYEEPGFAKGAYATITAAEFYQRRDKRKVWRAVGIGDTCLFQVRDESLCASFPMSDSVAFSYQPALLASRGAEEDVIRRSLCQCEGGWEQGDSFYLVTDALAAWFLCCVEAGGQPWGPLRDLDTDGAESDFADWVNDRRDRGEMHDDDTTLVRVDML